MASEGSEPRVRPRANGFDERVTDLAEHIERLLTAVITFFIVGLALLAIGDAVLQVVLNVVQGPEQAQAPGVITARLDEAIVSGIDAIFLAIILLELLHTTLSRGPIGQQLQEFLVIGITAAVRHSLELASTGRNTPGNKAGSAAAQRDLVINLAINAVGALILVIGLYLVRSQLPKSKSKDASPVE